MIDDTTTLPATPAAPVAPTAWWRAATIFCLVVMAIALAMGMSMFEQFSAQIHHLQGKLNNVQQIRYLSVMQDERHAAAMLVTLDPQDKALHLQRLNAVAEGREDTMQLWALDARGEPRSLGVLTRGLLTLRVPVEEAALGEVTRLAISVEDKGGVEPGQAPRLPYLFEGAWIQKAL